MARKITFERSSVSLSTTEVCFLEDEAISPSALFQRTIVIARVKKHLLRSLRNKDQTVDLDRLQVAEDIIDEIVKKYRGGLQR